MQGPIPVTLPHIPGIDVAGTVDALGEGVDGLAGRRPGRRVPADDGDGAAAEYVVAPAEILAPAPTSIPLADAAALPLVGLTAWQALFDARRADGRAAVLINGAGGAVGGYAVQLAKDAGAHVIATASPRSSERVRTAGADEVIDHTTTEVTAAVTEPVDVVLNLAPIDPAQLAALAALVRDGGVVVNTTVWMPAPADEERGVRGIDLFVRSDAEQLSGWWRWSTAASCASTSPSGCRWPSCRRPCPGGRGHAARQSHRHPRRRLTLLEPSNAGRDQHKSVERRHRSTPLNGDPASNYRCCLRRGSSDGRRSSTITVGEATSPVASVALGVQRSACDSTTAVALDGRQAVARDLAGQDPLASRASRSRVLGRRLRPLAATFSRQNCIHGFIQHRKNAETPCSPGVS